MEQKLFIPILLGTARQARQSEKAANLVYRLAAAHPEIETQMFDPRKMDLPMDDDGQDLKFRNPGYRNAIMRADGLIIVSPEYNHGYPGSLKRALDILLKEYIHRAVGLVGVSAGGFGGTRMIENLASVVRELGLIMTFTDVNFAKIGGVFDEKGDLLDKSYEKKIGNFLEELIWMAKVLRWGRQNLPSRYDEQIKKLEEEWKIKQNNL